MFGIGLFEHSFHALREPKQLWRESLRGELRLQAVTPAELANSQCQPASHVVEVILDLSAVANAGQYRVKQKDGAIYSQNHDTQSIVL